MLTPVTPEMRGLLSVTLSPFRVPLPGLPRDARCPLKLLAELLTPGPGPGGRYPRGDTRPAQLPRWLSLGQRTSWRGAREAGSSQLWIHGPARPRPWAGLRPEAQLAWGRCGRPLTCRASFSFSQTEAEVKVSAPHESS